MTSNTGNNAMQNMLRSMQFNWIGKYNSGKRTVEDGIKISERLSLVYIFVANNQIMYVGKSKQGYTRPLNYHKNKVMKYVNEGVIAEDQIDIYVRIFETDHEFEGLLLNMYLSYEEALITKFQPPWNQDKPRAKKIKTAD